MRLEIHTFDQKDLTYTLARNQIVNGRFLNLHTRDSSEDQDSKAENSKRTLTVDVEGGSLL